MGLNTSCLDIQRLLPVRRLFVDRLHIYSNYQFICQIFLDTETTGLSADNGDRIIEIGCVEMVNRKLTGNNRLSM